MTKFNVSLPTVHRGQNIVLIKTHYQRHWNNTVGDTSSKRTVNDEYE